MGIHRRKIASFNLNIIYLIGIILILWWSLYQPISHLINNLTVGNSIICVFEIIWKIPVTGLIVLTLMVINSYFFTNTFEKD